MNDNEHAHSGNQRVADIYFTEFKPFFKLVYYFRSINEAPNGNVSLRRRGTSSCFSEKKTNAVRSMNLVWTKPAAIYGI